MFEIRRILTCLVIIICQTSIGYGQSDFGFTPVSSVLNNLYFGSTMEINDSILYIASYQTGLGMINLSDPENPQMMPTFTNENGFQIQPKELKIIGDRAYFSTFSHFVIANIEDPENIEVIGGLEGYRLDFCGFSDKYLITRGYSNRVMGTLFTNIEDPENPREVFFYDQSLNGAIIHDDIAYSVGGDLIAVDLSDSADVRSVAIFDPGFSLSGTMKIEGNILYVGGGHNLTLVNIEDPENMEVLFREEYEEYLRDFCVEDGILYGIWGGDIRHVKVWDFNDPQDPQQLGSFDVDQDRTSIRKYNSTLVTMSSNFPHIDIYNIENENFENSPLIYSGEHLGHVKDVEVSGNTAYVTLSNTGLGIIDITNAEEPELITTLRVPEPDHGDRICYFRDHIYYDTQNNEIFVIDVTDRESPEIISQIEDIHANKMYAVEDLLFAACNDFGLFIYDIENPDDPRQVWHWEHENIYDVCSINNFVYITERTGDHGGMIHVFDISNIRNPEEQGLMEGYFGFIVCSEDYVMNGESGINLRSRHDPVNIPVIGETSSTFASDCILTENDQFYICSPSYGVKLLEIIEFENDWYTLPIAGQFDTPGYCNGIAEQNGIVYLADDYSLIILTAPEINKAGYRNVDAPTRIELLEAFPNPFNSTTQFKYNLPHAMNIELSIYDIDGRRIHVLERGRKNAGNYNVVWQSESINSGCYFVRLTTPFEVKTDKVIKIR